MYPNWRSLCGIFTLAAASVAMLGCGSTSNTNVRAVNASPGFSNFTFQVGQTGIAAALPYGTEGVQPKGQYTTNDSSGAYRQVGAATGQTVLTYATPGKALASVKQSLLKNNFYTIVSIGSSPSMGLVVLTDNDSAPPSGQYNLRFANYSGYSPIDLYITAVGASPSGNPVMGNVGFNQPTYLPLAPGTLELQVTPHNGNLVLATAPFSPAAGSIYSVFFIDPTPGTGSYKLLIVTDPVSAMAKSSGK